MSKNACASGSCGDLWRLGEELRGSRIRRERRDRPGMASVASSGSVIAVEISSLERAGIHRRSYRGEEAAKVSEKKRRKSLEGVYAGPLDLGGGTIREVRLARRSRRIRETRIGRARKVRDFPARRRCGATGGPAPSDGPEPDRTGPDTCPVREDPPPMEGRRKELMNLKKNRKMNYVFPVTSGAVMKKRLFLLPFSHRSREMRPPLSLPGRGSTRPGSSHSTDCVDMLLSVFVREEAKKKGRISIHPGDGEKNISGSSSISHGAKVTAPKLDRGERVKIFHNEFSEDFPVGGARWAEGSRRREKCAGKKIRGNGKREVTLGGVNPGKEWKSLTRIQILLKLIFNDKLIIDYQSFSMYLCGWFLYEK